jgi:hypothetical protein
MLRWSSLQAPCKRLANRSAKDDARAVQAYYSRFFFLQGNA